MKSLFISKKYTIFVKNKLKMKNIKFGFDDVNIVPEVITDIMHRSDCYVDTSDLFFAAPMSSVVSTRNLRDFIDNGITPVIPRTVSIDERMGITRYFPNGLYFVAFSLQEIKDNFFSDAPFFGVPRICIDVANGHMSDVIETIKALKDKYGPNIVVMAGNIANPKTYKAYDEAGCDYVRCGIGGGSGCLTASNTGVFYPLFSLLKETYEVKKKIGGKCKIIADGGIRGYKDIQLALLYADCVMMGGLFNKSIESAGKTTYGKSYFVTKSGKKYLNIFRTLFEYGKIVPKEKYKSVMERVKSGKLEVWKEFYGMSSKRAQKEMGNKTLKTSEGVSKKHLVEYDMEGFMENEISYLKSAMSYTNSRNLEEYKDSNWVAKISIGHNK